MARYPNAVWNPAPRSCWTKRRTEKIAVCDHRMVGWAGYLRKFQHLKAKPPRKVSAMFTLGMDGSVEQHVDTDYIAWTQGIGKRYYPYARKHWPLFREHNPNIDCVGIEHEDGGKPFSAERPMPEVQFEASLALHRWLFDEVLEAEPVLGETLIPHDVLTPMRNDDPGDWFMEKMATALAAQSAAQPSEQPSEQPAVESNLSLMVQSHASHIERLESDVRELRQWRERIHQAWEG